MYFILYVKIQNGLTLESNIGSDGQYIQYGYQFRQFRTMTLEPSAIKRLRATDLLQKDF